MTKKRGEPIASAAVFSFTREQICLKYVFTSTSRHSINTKMRKNLRSRFSFAFAPLIAAFVLSAAVSGQSLTFKVDVDPSVASAAEPLSGRLLIFMKKDDGKPTDGFGTDFT